METWTTQDGTVIKVSEMETSHIENCIKMLKNQIVDPWAVHGYDPQMGYGGYMDSLINDSNERKENKIKAFEEELSSRNNK